MTITTSTENSTVQCTNCGLIHAYQARKRKPVDDMFTVSVCPDCECQAYRNTEMKIEQEPIK